MRPEHACTKRAPNEPLPVAGSLDTRALAIIIRGSRSILGEKVSQEPPRHDTYWRVGLSANSAPLGSGMTATVAIIRVPRPGAVSISR